MDNFLLSASSRQALGKAVSKIRAEGNLPAVVYGAGSEAQAIQVGEKDFRNTYRHAGGTSLIDLVVDNSQPVKVVVQDVQNDPVSDQLLHIDFYQVQMDKKIRVEASINLVGESPAVREMAGVLVKSSDTVTIECLPDNLIQKIDVNLSQLKEFDDIIKLKDLIVPENIELIGDDNNPVVSVKEPRKVEERSTAEAETEMEEGATEEETTEGEKATEETKDKEETENKKEE